MGILSVAKGVWEVISDAVFRVRCDHDPATWEDLDGRTYCDACGGFVEKLDNGSWYVTDLRDR